MHIQIFVFRNGNLYAVNPGRFEEKDRWASGNKLGRIPQTKASAKNSGAEKV